jgi:hypothetical protein
LISGFSTSLLSSHDSPQARNEERLAGQLARNFNNSDNLQREEEEEERVVGEREGEEAAV